MVDVIVIGAGPAGSTAAATLAASGRSVLMMDRSTFPRDKTCGDAIQHGALQILRTIGYHGAISTPTFTSVTAWSIAAPSGHVATAKLHLNSAAEFNPYIAPRQDFDQLVFQQAISNGAEFLQGQVTAPIIENGYVVGVRAKVGSKVEQEFRAPIVIAADGATSVIARSLRGTRESDNHRAIAIRCYAKMNSPLNKHCEFYFPKVVMPGYAWIFPVGDDDANIGVGIRLDKYRPKQNSLETLLNLFLDLLGDRVDRTSIRNIQSWQIPFGSHWESRAFDGCMLVGDAGSFVDPLLGAGIYHGMKTGQLAAQVADRALTAGDVSQRRFAEYDRLWKRELGWALRRATLVQRIVVSSPLPMNLVIGLASLNKSLGRRIVMMLSGEKI